MGNGNLNFLSFLSGGLKGYNDAALQAKEQARQDREEKDRQAQLNLQQSEFDQQKQQQKIQNDRQSRIDQQNAYQNAAATVGSYTPLWMRTNPTPETVYGVAHSIASRYGMSDPDSFAGEILTRYGMARSKQTSGALMGTNPPINDVPNFSPAPVSAPILQFGNPGGLSLNLPKLSMPPLQQPAPTASGTPTLPPLPTMPTGSTATGGQATQLPPLTPVGSNSASSVQPSAGGIPQLPPLTALNGNGDPYLQSLMTQYNSPFNPDPQGTMKAIMDYQDKLATRQDTTIKGLNTAYDRVNTDWANSLPYYNDPNQQRQYQLAAVEEARSMLSPDAFKAWAAQHIPVGDQIGTQDVAQQGPPTQAMLQSGQASLPPLSKTVLQPLYAPNAQVQAEINEKQATANKTGLEATKLQAESPTWRATALADLNDKILSGNATAAKIALDQANLSFLPQEKRAQIAKDIAEGNLAAASAKIKLDMEPYDQEQIMSGVGKNRADIAKMGADAGKSAFEQDTKLDNEKQSMLNVISENALKLQGMGMTIPHDAQGNIRMLGGDPNKPVYDGSGQPISYRDKSGQKVMLTRGAANAVLQQMMSAQQRANRLDQVMTQTRSGSTDTGGGADSLIGMDFGRSGCVRGARAFAQAEGLPFPDSGDGVGKTKAMMIKSGYVTTNNPNEADFFISPGTGGPNNPSGLHIGAIKNGMSYQSDSTSGGSLDTTMRTYPIPRRKGTVYYKYAGRQGTQQSSGLTTGQVANVQSLGGVVLPPTGKWNGQRTTTYNGTKIDYTVH